MKKILLLLSLVAIRQIHGQIITTVAGNGQAGYSGNGSIATSAQLNAPTGIVVDSLKNIYIADYGNNVIRKVNTSGIITTIAGNGVSGFGGDNGPAASAQLHLPTGITLNQFGEIFIADQLNSRVRKIDTSGVITTVVGNGISGYSGDGGAAISASLRNPSYVAFDKSGNMFIADNNSYRIRKVTPAGIITAVVGNGSSGNTGDGGPATQATIIEPSQMMFDSINNLYFTDESASVVRKVDTNGIITTIAGNGILGNSGDNGLATSAKLNAPTGLVNDKQGNIYIADLGNNNIRKINSAGIITTIAGTGNPGFNGDNIPAITAELYYPVMLAFDWQNNLYIADYANNRIRIISNVVSINPIYQANSTFSFHPNPTSDQFFIETNTTGKLNVDLFDVNGRHVFSASVMDKSNISVTTLDEGIYSMTIKSVDHVTNTKLVIVR